MKQYEKQYAASAAAHSGQSSKKGDHTHKAVTSVARQEQPQSNGAGKTQQRGAFCWGCREDGHIKRNCPKKTEVPDRSQVAGTRTVEATPNVKADDLTEEQLEQS